MSQHTLVIGIGNTLRGDDGIGYLAAEQLAGQYPSRVSVIATRQLLPEHIDDLRRAERVIFVDASVSLMEGAILQRVIEADPTSQRMTHHMTPEQILWYCQHLFGYSPEAHLLTVGVRCDEVYATSFSNVGLLQDVMDALQSVLE